ncbi:unnamed protein product [Vitrella brassicaformis CCMP3155]|uniref:Uncharacterized protein n=1 Tax=Vitrella brassicaformis (strain CCMP3155) TaxID=1169540 RepID=A0A0G4EMS8_VITBC|nr:unnamed protein product [Vitrella brassicaformis CCMP3155]|eukprot:CEL98119.1 unnamed protein product [Vitrella brassicaformis CCMP3155]
MSASHPRSFLWLLFPWMAMQQRSAVNQGQGHAGGFPVHAFLSVQYLGVLGGLLLIACGVMYGRMKARMGQSAAEDAPDGAMKDAYAMNAPTVMVLGVSCVETSLRYYRDVLGGVEEDVPSWLTLLDSLSLSLTSIDADASSTCPAAAAQGIDGQSNTTSESCTIAAGHQSTPSSSPRLRCVRVGPLLLILQQRRKQDPPCLQSVFLPLASGVSLPSLMRRLHHRHTRQSFPFTCHLAGREGDERREELAGSGVPFWLRVLVRRGGAGKDKGGDRLVVCGGPDGERVVLHG